MPAYWPVFQTGVSAALLDHPAVAIKKGTRKLPPPIISWQYVLVVTGGRDMENNGRCLVMCKRVEFRPGVIFCEIKGAGVTLRQNSPALLSASLCQPGQQGWLEVFYKHLLNQE